MSTVTTAIRTDSPNRKGIPLQRSGKSRPTALKRRRPPPVVKRRLTLFERLRSEPRLLAALIAFLAILLLLILYAIRIASSASVYAPSQAAAVIVDDVHKRASQPLNRPVAHQPRSRQPATSRPASANDVRSNEGDLTDDAKDALRHAWQLDHPRAAAEHDAPRPDSADGQSRQPVVARSYEELKQELEGIDIDELSAALQAAMRDSDQ